VLYHQAIYVYERYGLTVTSDH